MEDTFKIVVSGSRSLDHADIFDHCFERLKSIAATMPVEVYSGDCKQGIDRIIHKYDMSKFVVTAFPADWSQGKAAGMIRNRQMAKSGNMLIAYWDGKSRGTKNMIDEAMKSDTMQVIEVYKIKSE